MTSARYTMTFGLIGSRLPVIHGDPFWCTRRRDLAAMIRNDMEMYHIPTRYFRQVEIRELWRKIAKYGSSNVHFGVDDGEYELLYHGLTATEYEEMVAEDDNDC